MKKKAESTGLQYVGQGAHLDVPRRDLTPDEVDQFGREWILSLQCPNLGSAMYAEFAPVVPVKTESKKGVTDG